MDLDFVSSNAVCRIMEECCSNLLLVIGVIGVLSRKEGSARNLHIIFSAILIMSKPSERINME